MFPQPYHLKLCIKDRLLLQATNKSACIGLIKLYLFGILYYDVQSTKCYRERATSLFSGI